MSTIAAADQSLAGISAIAKSSLWETLTATNEVGSAVNVVAAEVSLTFQATGTFNGATLTLRGSNKVAPNPATAADWFTLKQTDGTDATLTAAGGLSVLDLPLWVSPLTSGGGGSQDIDLFLVAR